MDVSVIIPAFGQAEYLPRTLDSVAAQTYRGQMEILVVDDGSPDDSARVAREHAMRPQVIEQENQGVAAARNTGIEAASGRYLAFLDSDDVWHPSKLEKQITALDALNRPALSFTRYERKSETGSVSEPFHPAAVLEPTPSRLIRGNFIGCSTAILHRDVIERVGGFPTDALLRRGGQDYALWLRVAAFFPLVYINDVLVDYTVHATNRVGADPIKHFQGGIWALRSLWEWDSVRFRAMAHMDFTALARARSAKLFADLISRPHHRSRRNLARALRVALEAPRQTLDQTGDT